MDYFYIISVLVIISAAFGYINVRFLKLPNTIGLMLITIVFTLGVFGLSFYNSALLNAEKYIITHIDFKEVLLDIMLSFFLFAGALHTNFNQLRVQRWPIFGWIFYVLCAPSNWYAGGVDLLFVIRSLDFSN